jgi:hypothetical protein
MRQCDACEGFIPAESRGCPHCQRPIRRVARAVQAVAASGTLVTLMACYGMPACPQYVDGDKDGASVCTSKGYAKDYGDDCDDADPARRPGVPDPEGDGVDQNCDGVDGLVAVVSGRALQSAAPSGGSAAPQSSGTPAAPSGAPSAR